MRLPTIQKRAAVVPAVVLLALAPAVTVVRAAGVDEEYARRVEKLADDDIQGHYRLALWCKEQKAHALLRDECRHILRLNPDHEQAEILLKLANKKLGKKTGYRTDDDSPPGSGAPGETGAFSRVLTDQEIQSVRRAELMCGQPERITVKFENDVLERFYAKMETRPGYEGPQGRARFFKLPPAAKAQEILCTDDPSDPEIRDLFAKDVVITSDPARLREFERRVLPVITRGCATARCHGGPDGGNFCLFTGKKLKKAQVYTNFLLLQEYGKGKAKLVNRDHPEESLLLKYGLKSQPAGSAHPVAIDPLYRNRNDRKYQAVSLWLRSLAVTQPEYGVNLESNP